MDKQPLASDTTDPYRTPVKAAPRDLSLREVYLSSYKTHKLHQHTCRLCLQSSPDCHSFRCANPTHTVCSECADEWHLEKLCPVCKRPPTDIFQLSRDGPFLGKAMKQSIGEQEEEEDGYAQQVPLLSGGFRQ